MKKYFTKNEMLLLDSAVENGKDFFDYSVDLLATKKGVDASEIMFEYAKEHITETSVRVESRYILDLLAEAEEDEFIKIVPIPREDAYMVHGNSWIKTFETK